MKKSTTTTANSHKIPSNIKSLKHHNKGTVAATKTKFKRLELPEDINSS